MKRIVALSLALVLLGCLFCFSLSGDNAKTMQAESIAAAPLPTAGTASEEVPAYAGELCITVNENYPSFSVRDLVDEAYVLYSPLDELGRTGCVMACLGKESLPGEERGPIGNVQPSGWQTVRYDDLIEDRYLYNRCHVLGYQLSGDNGAPVNLFTGTRYLNVSGMLPFESSVASYIKRTGNHVLYRAAPFYRGDDLVATGIELEAYSVEDRGAGLCFHVFVYNVQPGIVIDYADGSSHRDPNYRPDAPGTPTEKGKDPHAPRESAAPRATPDPEATYILNTNTYTFHVPSCPRVGDMSEKNRQAFYGTREEAVAQGYKPCGNCHP